MLCINYTYYNNPELLKEVVDYYEPFSNDSNFSFTIIDDGSQDDPLTLDMIPDSWTALRVTEDHGWGNEICRNILMRTTPYRWNALMDLDYVICLQEQETYDALATNFPKYYHFMYDVPIVFQFEKGRRHAYNDITKVDDLDESSPGFVSINSFIVSKVLWNEKTFGYDMAFKWTYGYDFTFFQQVQKEILIPDTRVKKLALQATKNRPDPKDLAAFKDFFELQKEYIDKGLYKMFTTKSGTAIQTKGMWISPEARLEHCCDWPEVVDLRTEKRVAI